MSKKQYNFILKALFILFIFSINSAFSQENNIEQLNKKNTFLDVEIETQSKTTTNETQLMEKKNPTSAQRQSNTNLKVSTVVTPSSSNDNNSSNDYIPVRIDNAIINSDRKENQTSIQSPE